MKELTKTEWLRLLKPADIGLILADNFFSTLQNWKRKQDKNPLRASHGFLIINPPEIIEANGLFVSRSRIGKFVGATTQCWIYRYSNLSEGGMRIMLAYARAMVEAHGQYGVKGIVAFGYEFFKKIITGKDAKIKDYPGVYCTELTGKAIIEAGLPYVTNEPSFEVTPSDQRSWFDSEGIKVGWVRSLWYDGKKFWAEEGI